MSRTFGVDWNPALMYSSSWECLSCGSFQIFSAHDDPQDITWTNYIVGIQEVTEQNQSHSHEFGSSDYVFIIECPKCFEKFWFHVGGIFVDRYWDIKKEGHV